MEDGRKEGRNVGNTEEHTGERGKDRKRRKESGREETYLGFIIIFTILYINLHFTYIYSRGRDYYYHHFIYGETEA